MILMLHQIITLSPKRDDITFSELSDLMAPEIIPIELKFANDTKNTDVTPFACSDISFGYLMIALQRIH